MQSKKGKAAGADRETGLFHFSRLGYEVVKGVHLLALEDFSKRDLSQSRTFTLTLGTGVVWYPRPHFEFELAFHQRKNLQVNREFEDYGYLMLHYYL